MSELESADQIGRGVYRMVTILGAQASGKTSLVDEWINTYPGRVLMIDPNAQWGDDPRAVWPGVGSALRDYIESLKGEFSGLIVLDDADRYLSAHTSEGSVWRDLFTSNRHWRVDILVIARRPQGIPKDLIAGSSHLALFRIREPYARKYLGDVIDIPDLAKKIPRQPFKYLWVDVDAGKASLKATKKRAIIVGADVRDERERR